MNNNINDIYKDLKNLVEKTHKIIVLDEKTKESETKKTNETKIINETQINNIKINFIEKKTQSCQTTTTKETAPESHLYVSQPPAGRKGTKTDKSIINWSHSLRGYYF
tara:strand:- start:1276 stop:1599 length:324 start_codon:yes stop_codon:yes gene_type:complete